MIPEYFRVALRVILRHKVYSAINVLGLAVGIAATVLILFFIRFELGFDDFHRDGDRIYRVSVTSYKEGTVTGESPVFTPPLGPALRDEFPGVEAYTRISTPRAAYVDLDGRAFRLDHIIHADSTFFDMFSFPLVSGDRDRALVNPYSMVLTEENAEAMFGGVNPVGKTVRVNSRDLYTITGVVGNPPANSDIRFGALISFTTLYSDPNLYMDWNGGNQYTAYIRLHEGTPPDGLESRLPDFMWRHINSELAVFNVKYEAHLQPLARIHLFHEPDSESTRRNIIVFSIVAAFILFVACVNYVNLSIARATKRGKEIGIRKVLGADRPAIIRQFLSESLVMTFISSILALLMVELFSPLYAGLLPGGPAHADLFQVRSLVWVAAVIVVVGIAAGGYPAFYLASLRPADVLKSGMAAGRRSGVMRNALITLQFAISIALICSTIVIGRQISFLNGMDPGFHRDNILILRLIGDDAKSRSASLIGELKKIPGVTAATASSEVPVGGFTSNGYFPQGYDSPLMIHVVDVDDGFLDAYGIDLAEGKNFSPSGADNDGYLVNETLVKMLGWTDPVGKTIRRDGDHAVIGVVRDFNFASLHQQVGPLIITHRPWRGLYDLVSVRIQPASVAATVGAVRDAWHRVLPSAPLYYQFLDDMALRQYDREQHFGVLFLTFSGLAIWIALMGLLSLASYATEQRTKEIGIRKILGASVPGIVGLLSREFLWWIALSNLIAWPAAYFFVSGWLRGFAYRVDMGPWPFLVAGLAALVFGWLTVSVQTIRAAMSDPVRTLRYE